MWLGHRAYLEIADGAAADYNGAQTQHASTATASSPSTRSASSDEPAPPRRAAAAPRRSGSIDLAS